MRTVPTLALGILAGGAIFGSLRSIAAQPADQPKHAEVGRYQITATIDAVRGFHFLYMVDTSTGKAWYEHEDKWLPYVDGFEPDKP